jgi:3-oxoacyl-ACP reductase-like protein
MVSLSVHGAFSAQQTPPAAIAAAPAASAAAASSGCGERKLSQSEIDALVQQLLAEKKKNQQ